MSDAARVTWAIRFLQYLTAEHARGLLSGSRSVLDAAYESGLSGPGRLAATERGICGLSFVADGGREETLEDLGDRWSRAHVVRDDAATRAVAKRVFAAKNASETLHVQGTNFQIRVWEALLRVPEGALVTYSDLAAAVGAPRIVPADRVIRATGAFGDYRWGSARKKAIVGWEAARRERGERNRTA